MRVLYVVFLAVLLSNCKQLKVVDKEVVEVIVAQKYPDNVSKVFNAHGGVNVWNSMNLLTFEIEKPNGNEKISTGLKSRKSLIETNAYALGFDGADVWVKNKENKVYKGNAKFYHNLYFYFYAMPFVLGDAGINYEDTKPLLYEGKEYPGIKISYNVGIGASSKDEYMLYYDAETYKMQWLAYTATYFSKEKGKSFNLIKYDAWKSVNGLLMPTKLQWHIYKNGVIGKVRNEVNFVNTQVSNEKMADAIFVKPEGAKVIE